jgi:hypothetical protein
VGNIPLFATRRKLKPTSGRMEEKRDIWKNVVYDVGVFCPDLFVDDVPRRTTGRRK